MRRTIISTIYIAVAIVLAASCNKNENPVSPADKTVITAVAEQIGAGTKVEMAYRYDALWQTGDQIYVKQGQATDTFTLVDGAGSTKGTFKGTKSISGEVEAFYPVSVGETMEWPAVQTNAQAVPMYAKQSISGTEKEVVSFSSLGAMLQIVLTTSEKNFGLSKIKLYDNGKPMSGAFKVEGGKAVITSTDKSGITLDLGEVYIGPAAKYFNIAVPAGKYEDLHLEFLFGDGRVYKMSSTTMPKIKHNSVAKIALFLDVSHMPTGISLNHSDLDLIPGDVFPLVATVLPDDAENKNVIWSSSDENIVTVDQSGNVTAIARGKAGVTATAEFSGLSVSCEVSVNEYPVGAIHGKFSVGKNKRVFFSHGNMWKGTWTYSFGVSDNHYIEPQQWVQQPRDADSTWRADHVNHFYFGKEDYWAYAKDPNHAMDHAQGNDIFYTNLTEDTPNPKFNVNIDGKDWKGVWRILSDKEWHYLLFEREMTYDKPRYSIWRNGLDLRDGHEIQGLFIYPDDFNSEPVIKGEHFFEEIDELGIVFLRAGGYREITNVKRLNPDNFNPSVGWYWASNANPDDTNNGVYSMIFSSDNLVIDPFQGASIDSTATRKYGRSVRLVRDVRD